VSDTAPFINHYFSMERYRASAIQMIQYLLEGREGGKVVIDVSKMSILEARVELPHLGILVVETG